jgi:hypothetical protein
MIPARRSVLHLAAGKPEMGMFFTTSTVKDWYPLLNHEEFRNIVIGSMHAPKEIVSFPFSRQKLEYIHRNPCTSAADYLLEIRGTIPIEKLYP